jgi:hypothetical protein
MVSSASGLFVNWPGFFRIHCRSAGNNWVLMSTAADMVVAK